ncbi:MAG TPA: GSU2403 family nucleotidyltransferase fold protein [Steroidobacteraceae bacterium]|nr:GSU2403 family nucleotidyltransferase fold protein [Steroidobacteraceae bacterium]
MGNNGSLYRLHEAAIRKLYVEVKERACSSDELLPGTPGTLVKRAGTGHEYWYRSYYPAPRKRSEQFVGTAGNTSAYQGMQDRVAQSEWTAKQVAALSRFGYHVADKVVAAVLVEMHNRGILQAGMLVVGMLAYANWLNEYGAIAPVPKIPDHLALGRARPLKLAAGASFLSIVQATQLAFAELPGASSKRPSTSVKLAGGELQVDLLAHGPILGDIVAVPELDWHARTMPFYGYLLEGGRNAAILAGGHCIPAVLPDVAHLIWYKFYASTRRGTDAAMAESDLLQAATLAAILIEQDALVLRDSYRGAPRELRNAAHSLLPRLEGLLAEHPRARDEFRKLR